jgi:phosphonate transport system substrate-binding protein
VLRKILVWLTGVGLVIQLSACSNPQPGHTIETLRIGILPGQSEAALRERFTPLFEFLSEEAGLPYELVIPGDYEELLKAFGAGQIDLGYFGGVTFVKANTKFDAVPLVMRDVDSRFTSIFVVADESITTLRDLKDKRLGFGARLSTSGHHMPRHFLQVQYGITPEEYFQSIQYSGKHDRTAYWVRDGVIDAGVVNPEIISKMLKDGRLQQGDLRTVLTTPPYTNYVWAVNPRIGPVDRERIRHAFLQLSFDNPRHEAILSRIGAASFYPASVEDFSTLKHMMTRQGVL